MLADIPSQLTGADFGTWIFGLAGLVSLIAGILGCIALWKKITATALITDQAVTQAQWTDLQAHLNEFVTKSDFADLRHTLTNFASRAEMDELKAKIEKVDTYLHAGMHELKNDLHQNTLKTERALTLIEANFPPAAPGPGPVRGRGRARRDDS